MLVTIKNVTKMLFNKEEKVVDLHFLTINKGEYSDCLIVLETDLETMNTRKIVNVRREIGDYSMRYSFARRDLKAMGSTLRITLLHRLDDVLICTDDDLNRRTDCRIVPAEFHEYEINIDRVTNPLYVSQMRDYYEWGFVRAITQSIDHKLDEESEIAEAVENLIFVDRDENISIYSILEKLEGLEHSSHDIFRY